MNGVHVEIGRTAKGGNPDEAGVSVVSEIARPLIESKSANHKRQTVSQRITDRQRQPEDAKRNREVIRERRVKIKHGRAKTVMCFGEPSRIKIKMLDVPIEGDDAIKMIRRVYKVRHADDDGISGEEADEENREMFEKAAHQREMNNDYSTT